MTRINLKERDLTHNFDFEAQRINPLTHHPRGLQVSLSADSGRYPSIQNEPQKALTILEQNHYDPKVFCIAEKDNNISEFKVKSDRWDWIIKPANINNMKQIPGEFLNGLKILLKNGVKIDGLAIGEPELQESVPDVLSQELNNFLHTLKKISLSMLIPFVLAIKSASKSRNAAYKSVSPVSSPVSLVKKPDPVLLVRIQNLWIEIGRWK